MFANQDYNDTFYFDNDYLKKQQVIKKDPYRYILSEREESQCYHRVKRLIFTFGIPALYVYKHFRYHQELSRVRKLKFTLIQMLEVVPRVAVSILVLYPLGYSLFVDHNRLKAHTIAKYELQKFDPDWFTYDEYKYAAQNVPVYQSEDSVWGRLYASRLPFNYYQTPGWIRRLRESNPAIVNEVPPKYDFTPKGPREGTNFLELQNKRPVFLIDSNSV